MTTLPTTCHYCSGATTACDSVPDASIPGCTPAEAGYRVVPLCWLHAAERRRVATARVRDAIICPTQGIARVDYGRAGGDVVCPECGRKYYDHKADADHPFLTVLCDGGLVKL